MTAPVEPASRLALVTGGLRVPSLAKAGAAVILIGLVADAVEHTVVPHLHDAVVAGFPAGEHAAHLAVFIGMVLVLVGVIADGARPRGRHDRQEGSPRDAVR